MALYFADTEITGVKDLFPLSSKDITNIYFADTELFTVWAEYDGTLPATYGANGSALADYRVYGSAGGVGDETDNLFDKNATDANNGYVNNAYIQTTTGSIIQSSEYFVSEYIPISKTLSNNITIYERNAYVTSAHNAFYDVDKTLLYTFYNQAPSRTVSIPDNARYIRLSVKKSNTDSVMVSYQNNLISYTPFGYKLDMSVSDGTTSTTTPIYIGDTPLGEDEYVNYGEQKVYRRTENLYDANATDTSKGYLSNSYLYGNTIGSNPNWFISEYIPILADTDYIASGLVDIGALGVIATINVYDSNKQIISYETIDSSGDTEINSGVNGAFIRISARNEHKNTVVVKLKNVMPTDPPVSLPALPTVDGINVVDYAGQSAAVPSRFVAKYRKEGFN